MKIVVPLAEDRGLSSKISPHFGRAPYYAILEVSGGRVTKLNVIKNPAEEHSPGEIPRMIKELGVELVVTCNIGMRAVSFFRELGIEVMRGQCNTLKDALKSLGIDTRVQGNNQN